ncbi:MAG: HIT family protein [Candidatus Asgardarchaeia archaeon]
MIDESECPFCRGDIEKEREIYRDEKIYVIFDLFPVNKGHILVIPTRHVETYYDLTDDELIAINKGIKVVMRTLEKFYSPDGFNVGFNQGVQAGQTISHFHIHVIPRYKGDCNSPRGGIRKVILDLPTDSEHPLRERFVRSRPSIDEYKRIKEIFHDIWQKLEYI